ncbi:MAG: sulfatase-like hydrolase/transferase [Planctomycetes bacterium]|nr:sulfatase-like hydrolase/transferase [Planctomycetota bacterium]
MRRSAHILAAASLVCAVARGASENPAEPPRPNVVLIMVDDFGYECVGANGSTSYRTPHLDGLAAGGMRFEHCHVQPLCTPTRVQLMTGLYNVRNYVRFGYLDPAQKTFAQLFREAGYATCIAGKWQLGRDPGLPGHFGFDESCLWQQTRRPPRYANPGLEVQGREVDYDRGEYGPDIINAYAIDFIVRNREKPFLLYYPMILTHAPFQPTPDGEDWDPKATGEKVNNHPKHFADMVAYTDKMVGRLVAALERLGLRERTLILFIGDNGTGRGITSRMGDREVRGGKGTTLHTGTHVPLIASWPGVIPAGRVSRDLVDSTDFLPTICEAAGVSIPPGLALDGRSFLPQLRGERGAPREWIYCWYARDGGAKADREFAANQRFKLYRNGAFYDLARDPEERRPLEASGLSGDAAPARKLLGGALERFEGARPAALRSQAKEAPSDERSEGTTAPSQASRPNIVFFLVDDMGWQDTSVAFHDRRTPFNDYFRTPNMDRLGRAGVRFTQAYSCAVCTPTRVSWLTGRNAARHHVTNWILKDDTSRSSTVLLPPPWKIEGLQPGDAPTAAALLRDAGYRTIHVGKAHWGAVGTQGSDPCALGFDVNIAGHAAGAPASYQGRDRYGEGKPGKELWAVPGLEAYKGTDTHLTDALTIEACRELEKAVREIRKPFFLYLAHYAVHAPLQPHRPYDANYRDQPVAQSEILYASMVEGMDASLGRILDKLEELGVAGETLVVFYTDNGGVSHAIRGKNILGTGQGTHNKPLREGKGSAYEGGIRVPAIVAWAKPQPQSPLQKRIPIGANTRCARPIIIEDLFPTFLRWAGARAPADSPVDGEDITPFLAASDPPARTSPLIWHFPNVWTPYPEGSRVGYQPHSVIRLGNWKAIYFYEPERWELYDIARDIEEANDLAAKEPERLEALATMLRDRLVALDAPWPVERATGAPRRIKLPSATTAR